MKKICLIKPRQELVTSVKNKLHDVEIVTSDSIEQNSNFDLIVLTDYYSRIEIKGKIIIRSHLSLLPAFNTSTPVKDAYLSGVKVTGITINRVENEDLSGLILAQYPVMIDSYTNYIQLEEELFSLENKLVPLVIKSILDDKIFDIVELLTENRCGNGCSGCKNKCH